jgi:hypothetical protein
MLHQRHRHPRPIATVEVHPALRPRQPVKTPRTLWSRPLLPICPSLHSLSSLSSADEAIAFPGQQSPRILVGARVDGRSRGSMSTVSPCSSSAQSRSSARPRANAVPRFLSSRAGASPSPSEPEAHRRRTQPSAPPRALCLARIGRGGGPESPPPPCSRPATLVDPR